MRSLHLEKVGFVGTLITLSCCLGFAPLLALLAAIGASFLINDAVLALLLVGFLVLGGVGLFLSMRRHRHRWPLMVHIISAAGLVIFTFAAYIQMAIWFCVVGLIAASVGDVFLKRTCADETACHAGESAEKTAHEAPFPWRLATRTIATGSYKMTYVICKKRLDLTL